MKTFSRLSYEKGIVIVRCDGRTCAQRRPAPPRTTVRGGMTVRLGGGARFGRRVPEPPFDCGQPGVVPRLVGPAPLPPLPPPLLTQTVGQWLQGRCGNGSKGGVVTARLVV